MISALQERFAEPLLDLGDDDPRLRGIFTPQSERGVARSGVTSQFFENAGDYHERYSNVEGLRTLIGSLLGGAAETGSERFILDIGSGSGNSVIPLLDLYPGAFVVATDISPQLLVILRDFLEAKPEYRGRYGLVCMDANHDPFRPGAFDLAVGAAILHHIVDPRRVLRVCASALRPGGTALFIEPFEVGHGVLRIAYRSILADPRRSRKHAQGFAMLKRMIVDHEARLRDKSDPIFDVLDDKWYFTRSFFESNARAPEWQECRVEAINGSVSPMVDHAKMELRLGLGADESALPKWAWETIREHEKSFSSDGRRDMIFEGAVTLRRGATGRTAIKEPRDGWWWNPAEPGRGFFIEFHAGSARAACCAYAADGAPEWTIPPAGALDLSKCPQQVRLAGVALPLEPQHADLANDAHTGWWIEDGERSGASIVVEGLGDRLMAALFARDEWLLVVASQRGTHAYEGDWLRFSGGQTLSGRYRAPDPPSTRGRARLSWADEGCMVALLPDGRRRIFRRLGTAEAAPQNLRSMEKCAS
jgi:SAM-dependent methyltransferase